MIPPPLAAELDRINPGRIIVLGSSASVSDGVMAALDAYNTGGGVIRIGGANRYDTAASVSAFHHPGGAPFAYVASGANFPDALAAGPAAAVRGAPTILVQVNAIPGSISHELARLNMSRIIIVGGLSMVSQGVQNSLVGYTAG